MKCASALIFLLLLHSASATEVSCYPPFIRCGDGTCADAAIAQPIIATSASRRSAWSVDQWLILEALVQVIVCGEDWSSYADVMWSIRVDGSAWTPLPSSLTQVRGRVLSIPPYAIAADAREITAVATCLWNNCSGYENCTSSDVAVVSDRRAFGCE